MKRNPWVIGLAAFFILWMFFKAVNYILSPAVVAAPVIRGTAIKAVSGTLTVKAEVETDILSSGNGFLLESKLKEGALFKKGDIMARIDPGNLPFQIESQRIKIETLKRDIERGPASAVQLKAAKRKRDQSKALLNAEHISQNDYNLLAESVDQLEIQTQKQLDQMQTELQVLENDLDRLEDNLDRLNIRAPMDGTITRIYAYTGDLLSTGSPIAGMISKGMKISAEVNQDDIEVIKPASKANVRFFAYGDQLFTAKVRQILPSTDPETQRFSIILDMDEAPESMLPGMTGEVSFLADEHENALLIPRRALMGQYVFVIDGGDAERRKVRTGYLTYSDAEILEGLEEGDLVITEGMELVRDGDSVVIDRIEGEE